MRDILCTSCGDVAMQVDDAFSGKSDIATVNLLGMVCAACGAAGTVEQVDDGEQAMLVFRVESEA